MPALHEAKEPTRLALSLIRLHHEHLADAGLLVLFSNAKPARDGGCRLYGQCKIADPLDRFLSTLGGNRAVDLVLVLCEETWRALDAANQRAQMDHLLTHFWREDADNGGSTWRLVKHEVGEFRSILSRHGAYSRSLVEFVTTAREVVLPNGATVVIHERDEDDEVES